MRFYNGWEDVFLKEFEKPYFVELKKFIAEQYETKKVYPPKKLIFNAFDLVSPEETRVVILGQDPYIREGQAMGLSFSVPTGVIPPPSLMNIYKEISSDQGFPSKNKGGDLTSWTKQGVLLLNTVLTVEEGAPNSHAGRGWEQFTDEVIKYLNARDKGIVFMLWGANAISKKKLITNTAHLVLTAPHPSPLSAYQGFYGCKHFTKANEFLANTGREISW